MGSVVQCHYVLATMLTYLLPPLISNPMHQGGSLQYQSRNQVLDSTFGLGYLRDKLYLKHNYYELRVLLYCYFCIHPLLQFLLLLRCASPPKKKKHKQQLI